MFGRLSVGLQSHHEGLSHLRPAPLSDNQLDPSHGPTVEAPWHGDDTSYVPGLNSLSDLFMVWHEAQSSQVALDPTAALRMYLGKVQQVIDSLPPELRWRGGLSRPANVTHGHDAQIANIFICSLHVRSNLLQRFGPTDTSALEHQRIVDDLLEILYHLPQPVFDSNGSSLVPKVRDIGAAYLEQSVVVDESARVGGGGEDARGKLERLLRRLDDLDCWWGLGSIESPMAGSVTR